MTRDPTATQRVATDPLQSAWVAANAGSGKTHVLVNRIARLLLAGAKPDRLLCVTFTRAAAAEMTTRLFKRLGDWALKDDAALRDDLQHLLGYAPDAEIMARARLLFAEALESPGGLRIQTIHAFCERLLKRFPLEAGVVPQFSVLDERVAEELISVARDDVLRDAHTDAQLREDIYSLTAHAGEEQFGKLMRDVASERSWLTDFIYPPTRNASLERRIYDAVGLEPGTTEDQIVREAVRSIDVDVARRAASALARGEKSDQERAPAFAAFAAQPDAQNYARVAAAVLTGDGEVRKRLATKAAISADSAIVDVLTGVADVALKALEGRNAVFIAENSSRLMRVSAVMLDAFQRAKVRRAALDYDDLIVRVHDLFLRRSTASWVLYKLDGGIDHILVDEAQDTSRAQWNVVTPIAREFFVGEGVDRKVVPGERTLFVVGDTKQSIMSFQGAEPLAFVETHEEAAAWARGARAGFESVTLLHSFRSARNILRLVDQVVRDPVAQSGVQLDRNPVEHLPVRSDMDGLVELWPVIEPPAREEPDAWDAPRDLVQAADPAVTLAERVAMRIADWLRAGEAVYDTQTRTHRAMRPGDVMILVRRRALLAKEIIRQLKSRGVAVAGADRLKLTEHIAIQDLIALGRFALLPGDELTLAAVLKSPLCGLDDDALFELAYDRGEEGLWSRLRRRQTEPRFAAACALLERVRNRADRTPPYEFYATLLSVDGGWRAMLERLGPDAADPIEEFVNAALEYEREHTPSLEGFLHWMETAQTEIKRDQERGADAVRVMTVHASKGLEAPVVILPDTCTTPEGGQLDEQLLDAEGVPLWKIDKKRDVPARARARDAAAAERMNEYQRLLYVALTRARDRLYVCGYTTSKGMGEGCWYELVERAMTALEARAVLEGEETIKRFGDVPPPLKRADAAASAPDAAAPSWLHAPARAEGVVRTLSPSEAVHGGGRQPRPNAVPSPGDPLSWGRVIHRLLEVLANLTREEWEARARAVASSLLGESERIEEAVSEALRVRSNPELAWLFGTGSYGEVSLRAHVNWRGEDVEVAARLDRVVDRGANLTIVEFKTDRFVPAHAEEISKAYVTQLALYARALAPLFPGKTISAAVVWTSVSRLDTVPSKLLEGADGQLDPLGGRP